VEALGNCPVAPALKSGPAAAMSVNCCPAVRDHSRFAVYTGAN